jgi:hypothetical protein
MATHLTITATHDGTVSGRDVRDALRGIDADDISVSSPVTSPAGLSTVHETVEPDQQNGEPTHLVHVQSGEHDEAFTKTTTDAIVGAISALAGVSAVDVDGGYEPPEEDEDEDDGVETEQ